MTTDRESRLFEFANSKRPPTDEEEQIVTDMHAALGMSRVPIQLMHPPAVKAAPRWNRYVLAVAALLMVFALGRASFMALQSDPGGVPTDVPPVVLGLASQAPATSVEESCDFTGTVPFIAGMDESPLDEPTLLHRLDRSLVKDCNGQQELLLDGVMIAGPTRVPHVIHALTLEGDYFINIVSLEQLFIPAQSDTSITQIQISEWGPWMIMRSSDETTSASVYNLETMTETPIITHAREPLSTDELAEAPMHSDDNRVVIAYPKESEAGTKYFGGFFVVEADGNSQAIIVGQEAFPRELAVSPGGQILATASFHGTRGEGTTTVTLFGTQDDEVIEQYEIRTMDQPVELAWQHDGSGLLLHDTTNLYRIDAEHPGDGLEILAEGQNLQRILLTPDNDVVVIGTSVASTTPSTSTLIVNIRTREVIEVEWQDMFANPYLISNRTTLVLENNESHPGQDRVLTMVDAVSGETLGTVEFEPIAGSNFNFSAYGVGDGDITVIAFRPDSIWRLVDDQGNAVLEPIESPPIAEGTSVEAVTIQTSPDGYLSLIVHESQQESTTWLLLPGSTEWIQIDLPSMADSQGMIPMLGFVIGNDD